MTTTAEKRAELGDNWPNCECHGVPLNWHRNLAMTTGGRFRCRVTDNEKRRAWRQRLKAEGRCVQCSQPADTDTLCDAHAAAHNNLMGRGKQAMDHQLAQIRYRRRKRGET